MEAIILAGGLGTRLRNVVSDVPKPMAPMNQEGKPFLEVLLDFLISQDVSHVVMSIGYKGDIIYNHFDECYKGMSITYVKEISPLLTGGAIKLSLQKCRENPVFVFNGDTFFDVDLKNMELFHREHKADLTIAVKEVEEVSRYGTVGFTDTGLILSFDKKENSHSKWINGGVYCVCSDLLNQVKEDRFSMEADFIQAGVECDKFYAYPSSGTFVDIGIPEDYERAKNVLRKYFMT